MKDPSPTNLGSNPRAPDKLPDKTRCLFKVEAKCTSLLIEWETIFWLDFLDSLLSTQRLHYLWNISQFPPLLNHDFIYGRSLRLTIKSLLKGRWWYHIFFNCIKSEFLQIRPRRVSVRKSFLTLPKNSQFINSFKRSFPFLILISHNFIIQINHKNRTFLLKFWIKNEKCLSVKIQSSTYSI